MQTRDRAAGDTVDSLAADARGQCAAQVRSFKCPYSCLTVVVLATVLAVAAGCSDAKKRDWHLKKARRYEQKGNYQAAVIEYVKVLRTDESNPEAVRQLGMCYYETDDFKQAAACFMKACELEPSNTAVRLKLGKILLAAGHVAQARERVMQILETDPTSRDGLLLLSDVSIGTNELAAALAAYESAAPRLSNDSDYHVGLGSLYQKQRKPEKAEAAFRRALTLSRTNAVAHAALARLYAGQGRKDEACLCYEKSVSLAGPASAEAMTFARFLLRSGDNKRAKALLDKALQAAPEILLIHTLLAQAAFQLRDFDTCLDYVEKVLARKPDHVGAATLKADANAVLGKPDQAVATYEKLLVRFPNNTKLRRGLARALLARGDARRAVSELQAALAAEPGNMACALMLADARLAAGDVAGATGLLEKLVQQAPEQHIVLVRLASAYQAAQRHADSVRILRKLRELKPDAPEALYALGLAQHAAGDDRAAAGAFEKAVGMNPDFLPALTQLAMLDVAGDRQADAVARLEAQIARRPDDARLRYLLGRIHAMGKNWDAAEAALLKAIDLKPQSPEAYVLLSRVYRATGNVRKTLAKLEAALSVSRNDPSALILAAGVHAASGNETKAIELYERLRKKQPAFVPALNNLAVLYSRHPEGLDKAYELAQKAHELAPRDASVQDTLGWIFHLRGDDGRARGLLKQSAEKHPWHAEIQYHLGVTQYALGDEKAALAALEKALSDDDKYELSERDAAERLVRVLRTDMTTRLDGPTVAMLESVVREDPGNAGALTRLGAAAEQAKRWEKAEQYYRKAVASCPSHAVAHKAMAKLYLSRLNNAEAARQAAKKARDLAPGDHEALVLLGRAAYESGDFKWAASLLQEGVRATPGKPLPQYWLGLANYACGRLAKAEEALKRAADAASPQAADAKRILALMRIAREKERGDAAKRLIESSLATSNRDVPALVAHAALQAAEGNATGASAAYERVIRLRPDFAPAMAELARLYADREDKAAEAMRLAKKARELLPKDPRVAEVLGAVAGRQGDHKWAVSLLNEALRGAEQPTAELLYRLGESEFHCKDKAAALKHLRDALRTADDAFPFRAEAERMIKELQ